MKNFCTLLLCFPYGLGYGITAHDYQEMRDCDTVIVEMLEHKLFIDEEIEANNKLEQYRDRHCSATDTSGECKSRAEKVLHSFYNPYRESSDTSTGTKTDIYVKLIKGDFEHDLRVPKAPTKREYNDCVRKFPFILEVWEDWRK